MLDIKPEDHRWNNKMVCDQDKKIKILHVGMRHIFYRNEDESENSVPIHVANVIWGIDRKKIVLKAPAVIMGSLPKGAVYIGDALFSSYEEAEATHGLFLVKWPANNYMWVEIEEDI